MSENQKAESSGGQFKVAMSLEETCERTGLSEDNVRAMAGGFFGTKLVMIGDQAVQGYRTDDVQAFQSNMEKMTARAKEIEVEKLGEERAKAALFGAAEAKGVDASPNGENLATAQASAPPNFPRVLLKRQ